MNLPDPHSADDAQLEKLLQPGSPILADDGFTHRVLAALPPRAVKPMLPRRLMPCAVGGLVGLAFAWHRVFSSDETFEAATYEFSTAWANGTPQFADPSFLIALGVTVFSLAFALAQGRRHRARGAWRFMHH